MLLLYFVMRICCAFKGTKRGEFRGIEYEHDFDTSIKCENGVASLNENK
jgi:hypothetical protein